MVLLHLQPDSGRKFRNSARVTGQLLDDSGGGQNVPLLPEQLDRRIFDHDRRIRGDGVQILRAGLVEQCADNRAPDAKRRIVDHLTSPRLFEMILQNPVNIREKNIMSGNFRLMARGQLQRFCRQVGEFLY